MPEVVILGSGTSNGVPMLGVKYPPEYLATKKNWRTRSSIIVLGPAGNLLVDCAPELRLQMAREELYDIDAVIATHSHADHIMGMDDLRSICIKTRLPMPIYADDHTQADLRRVFPYAFVEDAPKGIELPRFYLYKPRHQEEICGMTVKFLRVMHGKTPVLGLRINNFAYITDVNFIPDEELAKLDNLDVLILDAVRYKPHPNHFNYDQAVEMAQKIGAKQTYFTHLSSDYDHDVTNLQLPGHIQLSYDGLRIQI